MNVCNNCNAPVSDKYCSRCGEKVYSDSDRSFKHLFEEAFHFQTHLEGKFFTTLTTMVGRPGKVSFDFCNGVRKKYFKPLSFYLLLIIAYLLFPVFEGLNMQMKFYPNNKLFGQYAERKIEEVRVKRNYSEEKMAEVFHQKGEKTSKFMLFVILPFMGLFSYAIAFWKRKFYFDHFIFATEVTSFYLLFGFLVLPLILVILAIAGIRPNISEFFVALIIFGGGSVYASFAGRRFFQFKRLVSIPYGLLFGVALALFVQYGYKFILFNVLINLV